MVSGSYGEVYSCYPSRESWVFQGTGIDTLFSIWLIPSNSRLADCLCVSHPSVLNSSWGNNTRCLLIISLLIDILWIVLRRPESTHIDTEPCTTSSGSTLLKIKVLYNRHLVLWRTLNIQRTFIAQKLLQIIKKCFTLGKIGSFLRTVQGSMGNQKGPQIYLMALWKSRFGVLVVSAADYEYVLYFMHKDPLFLR